MHYKLPYKYYFINKLDTNLINKQDKQTAFIYRNYTEKNISRKIILKFKNFCKKKGNKFYLANNIRLALNLKLDGAYIPSFNKNTNHLNYSIPKSFKLLGSSHNIKEIRTKEIQKVDILFISSLFKKNKNLLGINKFKLLSKSTKKKVIALGGISRINLKKLKIINCFGFAGISYFQKKTAP